MKLRSSSWLSGLVLAGSSVSLCAQQAATPVAAKPTPPAPAATSAGLANDWLREQDDFWKHWDLGGQFRARVDAREYFAVAGVPNAVDFRATTPVSENTYWLLRERWHAGYSTLSWFSIYGEGQSSQDLSDDRTPPPEENVPADLYQAYVTLGNPKEFPLTAKIGRQELNYGDQRLIGSADWTNLGRVFDAAKLRYETTDFWVDAFTSHVVIPENEGFDQGNQDEFFSGAYASSRTLLAGVESQAYFLADNANAESYDNVGTGTRGNSPRDVYTVGVRFKSLPGQFSGWNFEAECAGQFGQFAFNPTSPMLDQSAYALHGAGGYTFEDAWAKPNVTVGANYGSGDDDPLDGTHGTFVNLFPTNHRFYGYMDFLSWQNMQEVYLSTTLQPAKNLTATVNLHNFWLANTDDYFYQSNGQPRTTGGYGIRPGAGNLLGQEIDVVLTYKFESWGQIQGGYGHFFTQDYIDTTLAPFGGSHDANYGYLMATFNF